jgi:tRNA G18 (ribose-2'-O)-methylase SpoU
MTVVPVTRLDDPRLSDYVQLRDAELLRQRGLFVAEGRFVVERVLADARYDVESLLLNAASYAALAPQLEARASSAPVFVCETSDFQAITGFHFHRGCLAMVRRPPALSWRDAVGDARLVVVLEGVTNADNVGGVFRNAAAFGAGAVLLSPTCCDPLYRKAVRTSVGHVLSVPFARVEPWPDALKELHDAGFTLAALSPREPAALLDEFVASRAESRVALLVGTEGDGVSDALARRAGIAVRIPMRPGVDSLNLSVACGVALSRLATLTTEALLTE